MEEIFYKLAVVLIMIVVSWKLMLESIWESFQDDINMKRAKKELPLLAKELKLKHRKGDEFGIYEGSWNNHKIRIEPNNFQAAIFIKSKSDPRFSAVHEGISPRVFHINTLFHHLKNLIIKFIPDYPVDENRLPLFNFDDGQLDGYFQDRRLQGDSGKEMARNQELMDVIKAFIDNNKRIVKNLAVGQEVACSLWLGSSIKPRLSSVTGEQVTRMLSEMLPIIEALEKSIKK